jgi:hypothetical protein
MMGRMTRCVGPLVGQGPYVRAQIVGEPNLD